MTIRHHNDGQIQLINSLKKNVDNNYILQAWKTDHPKYLKTQINRLKLIQFNPSLPSMPKHQACHSCTSQQTKRGVNGVNCVHKQPATTAIGLARSGDRTAASVATSKTCVSGRYVHLAPYWIRLVQTSTNPGLFQIRCTEI